MSDRERDFSAYEHPMRSLAEELGGGLIYPVPISDSWVRVALAVAPCSILVLVSICYPLSAPFLLTFAGAFASIQLVDPYKRWAARVNDFLSDAREQHRTALDMARARFDFHRSAVHLQWFTSVGYSHAAQARARRRFPRLARRWRRSFSDISGVTSL